MNYGLKKNEIDLIKSVFEKYPDIEQVFIYGSRAQGSFKKTSDIDLMVRFGEKRKSKMVLVRSDLEDLPLIYKIDASDELEISAGKFKDEYERTRAVFYEK